jgi:hypothetical protein
MLPGVQVNRSPCEVRLEDSRDQFKEYQIRTIADNWWSTIGRVKEGSAPDLDMQQHYAVVLQVLNAT